MLSSWWLSLLTTQSEKHPQFIQTIPKWKIHNLLCRSWRLWLQLFQALMASPPCPACRLLLAVMLPWILPCPGAFPSFSFPFPVRTETPECQPELPSSTVPSLLRLPRCSCPGDTHREFIGFYSRILGMKNRSEIPGSAKPRSSLAPVGRSGLQTPGWAARVALLLFLPNADTNLTEKAQLPLPELQISTRS